MLGIDMGALTALLDEVVEIACSPRLLSGNPDISTREFAVGNRVVRWRVVDLPEYCAAIDGKRSVTAYTIFRDEFVEKVRAASGLFNGYGAKVIDDMVWERLDRINQAIASSESVARFIKRLNESGLTDCPDWSLHNHVINSLDGNFDAILTCRALTVSKRFTPLEVALAAYDAGLHPFGWGKSDPVTQIITCDVLCISP